MPLLDGRTASATVTTRADGDLASTVPLDVLTKRQRAVVDLPWRQSRQVHGASVVVVDGPRQGADPLPVGDAVVTDRAGIVVSVVAADCAPIALVSPEGVVAAVHAGWRGLAAGVIGATVDRMRDLGARRVRAALFACIRPECYEFGRSDLESLESVLGTSVRARTSSGAMAMDVPAAVRAAAGLAGVTDVVDLARCTSCDSDRRWFSHRARHEVERHALAVWIT